MTIDPCTNHRFDYANLFNWSKLLFKKIAIEFIGKKIGKNVRSTFSMPQSNSNYIENITGKFCIDANQEETYVQLLTFFQQILAHRFFRWIGRCRWWRRRLFNGWWIVFFVGHLTFFTENSLETRVQIELIRNIGFRFVYFRSINENVIEFLLISEFCKTIWKIH